MSRQPKQESANHHLTTAGRHRSSSTVFHLDRTELRWIFFPREEKLAFIRRMPVTHGRGLAAELPHGLIDACRKGEPNAFRALFELCKDDVYTIALNFTANETVAFDISQDVFVKLFSAIRSLRDASEFRTWLFRLVVNACTDEHRRAKRFVPAQDAPLNAASSTASPEEEVRERQLGLQVRSAVAGLAPRLRTAILLRYVEGFSYAEMARALGCSMGTIASRLSRGHKLLAQRLSHMRGAV